MASKRTYFYSRKSINMKKLCHFVTPNATYDWTTTILVPFSTKMAEKQENEETKKKNEGLRTCFLPTGRTGRSVVVGRLHRKRCSRPKEGLAVGQNRLRSILLQLSTRTYYQSEKKVPPRSDHICSCNQNGKE
jgi:hypothetical protein